MLQAIRRIYDFIALNIIGPIRFDRIVFLFTGRYYKLTSEDRDECRKLMENGHYIWLSRRNTHLTTYIIDFLNYLLGRFKINLHKTYTHAFFNISEDLLIEAIGRGVIHSYFDDVFDCDWICAVKINGLSNEEWSQISRKMAANSWKQLNKKYDTVFDIHDDSKLSCVELIRVLIVEAIGNNKYAEVMSDFERLMQNQGNLTPQMIRNSKSFDIVLEIKR